MESMDTNRYVSIHTAGGVYAALILEWREKANRIERNLENSAYIDVERGRLRECIATCRACAAQLEAAPVEDCSVLVTRLRRLAYWEVADDLQALRTRLACIGAACADAIAAASGGDDAAR